MQCEPPVHHSTRLLGTSLLTLILISVILAVAGLILLVLDKFSWLLSLIIVRGITQLLIIVLSSTVSVALHALVLNQVIVAGCKRIQGC